MYENILIPTFMDDKERLESAVNTARKLLAEGGKITLLHVVEEIPMYVETYVPAEVMAVNVEEVLGELKKVAASIGDDLDVRVIKGHAGRTIITQIEAMKSDFVVISSHRPGLADYFLGSTASHVVRHAKCSVLVLR